MVQVVVAVGIFQSTTVPFAPGATISVISSLQSKVISPTGTVSSTVILKEQVSEFPH